jgi:ketosteroid isomerase-like protein
MKSRVRFALLILATTISLLSACTPATAPAPESPRAIADRFIAAEYKAWSTGDITDLKAIESDGIVYHMPGQDLTGWKAHEDYINYGRALVSNLKQNWKYVSGDGNLFALSYEASGTMRGEGKNPSTDVVTNFLGVFRIQDGRIAEAWMNGTSTTTPVEEPKKK